MLFKKKKKYSEEIEEIEEKKWKIINIKITSTEKWASAVAFKREYKNISLNFSRWS